MTETRVAYGETGSEQAWGDIVRRVRSLCPAGRVSVVKLTLVVDGRGVLVHWLTPDVQPVEPRRSTDEFVRMLKNGAA